MSADNGVYILVSRGRKTRHGYRKEYRVIHAQAIENIYWNADDPWPAEGEAMLNDEYVRSYFGEATVLTDRKIAEGYAQCIYDSWMKEFGYVEYGICWLIEFANVPFPKDQPQRRRRTKLVVAG